MKITKTQKKSVRMVWEIICVVSSLIGITLFAQYHPYMITGEDKASLFLFTTLMIVPLIIFVWEYYVYCRVGEKKLDEALKVAGITKVNIRRGR